MATQSSGSVTPTLNTNIRHLAKVKGISLKRLADESGISERSFFRKLNTRPDTWTMAELGSIAHTLEARLSADIVPDEADEAA